MSQDVYGQASAGTKGKRAKTKSPRTPSAKPPTWPTPFKPKLNFMPERHRKVEYGRRAIRNGSMMVLATVLGVTGVAVIADAHKSNLQGQLTALTMEVNQADSVLRASEPVTRFYANYVDQRDAVAQRFEDEISPSRLFAEFESLAGSSVSIVDMNYDLTSKDCLSSDPFYESDRTGCITITGEASSPSALAGFVNKMNEGSALFTQARLTEARMVGKRMDFTMQTGYTAEAESNRGEQFTPTEEELSKVVKSIPNRFQEEQVSNGE